MSAQIQFRRGTAQDWNTSDPILAVGELGYETDTGKFKIGNGIHRWQILSYYAGARGPSGPSGVQGPAKTLIESMFASDTSTYYLNMSNGTGFVAVKNNTSLTYVASSGILTAPILTLNNTINSTSPGSGALIVAGGGGIEQDLYVGGKTFSGNDVTVGGQLYLNWNDGQSGPAILPGTADNLISGIFDIGSPDGKFASIHLSKDINSDGDLYTKNAQIGGMLYINYNAGETGPGILPGTISGGLLDDTYDIGSPNARFRNLYLSKNISAESVEVNQDIEVHGQLYVNCNTQTNASAILPGSSLVPRPNQIDIGSQLAPFRNIYARSIVGGQLQVTDLIVQNSITIENQGTMLINGDFHVQQDLYVTRNLYVSGTSTTVYSNTIQTGDKTIALSTSTTSPILAKYSGITVGPVNSPFISLTYNGSVDDTAHWVSSGGLLVAGEVVTFYSDRRLKDNVVPIQQALEKVNKLNGIIYTANDLAGQLGFSNKKSMVGLFADEVDAVLPEAVCTAPFDQDAGGSSISGKNYQTIKYEKLVPLLIEAVKELTTELDSIKSILKSAGLN